MASKSENCVSCPVNALKKFQYDEICRINAYNYPTITDSRNC